MTPNIFLPRGIRNNNPGNIRLSKIRWQGQKLPQQNDEDFVEFSDATYGLRALMRLFLTYYIKYGLDTVEAIINRYAPPYENATDSYIYHVSKFIKKRRRNKIDLTDKKILIELSKAIVLHENGKPIKGKPQFWYKDEIYKKAADLAFKVITL